MDQTVVCLRLLSLSNSAAIEIHVSRNLATQFLFDLILPGALKTASLPHLAQEFVGAETRLNFQSAG